MELRTLATLLSKSSEVDRAAVESAVRAAGYGAAVDELRQVCRGSGPTEPLKALEPEDGGDPFRRDPDYGVQPCAAGCPESRPPYTPAGTLLTAGRT